MWPHARLVGWPIGRVFSSLTFSLVAAVLVACAGTHGGADDPARAIAGADQRLQGTWLLVDFRPEVPLEPMLAQLLSMQIGHLTAAIDAGHIVATGLGVQAVRTYRIDSASMDRFKLTLFDDTGIAYETWAAFEGDVLRFEALTPPWRGSGTLKRLGSPVPAR